MKINETGWGNCFVNGFIFHLRNPGGKLRIKTRENSIVPHLIIDYGDHLCHFRVIKNILPWPLSYFFFKGRYEKKFKERT